MKRLGIGAIVRYAGSGIEVGAGIDLMYYAVMLPTPYSSIVTAVGGIGNRKRFL